MIGIAIPLYVVTMASQNVPGVAVMSSYGYAVPWRETMTVTGLGTRRSERRSADTSSTSRPSRRPGGRADRGSGPRPPVDRQRQSPRSSYLVLALGCSALAALVAAAPGDVIQAAAGLALLGTLGAALAGALGDEEGREAAVVCFLVAASGITVLGVGAAFWAAAGRPGPAPAAARGRSHGRRRGQRFATLKVTQVERSPSSERNVSPETTTVRRCR